MSAQVKLSLKAARELLQVACLKDPFRPESSRAQDELQHAIAKSERSSATRRKLKQPKAERKASKREETRAIRAIVMDRAQSRCELCRYPAVSLDLHHALSRRVPQAVSNCLAACRDCHRRITDNNPSAAYWLELQRQVFASLGHMTTAGVIEQRLGWVLSKAATP